MCRLIPLGLALAGLVPLAGCAGAGKAQPAKQDGGPPAVRSAECRWALAKIKVDGVLNEIAWEKAQVLQDFAVFWQKRKAKTATKARLLWDNYYLYFCAEMEDSDLYADVKEDNG